MSLPPFVPLLNENIQEFGLIKAAIIGAVWLLQNRKAGKCTASNETIGKMIGVERSTVSKKIKELIEANCIIDHTPNRQKSAHDIGLSVDLINRFSSGTVDKSNSLGNEPMETVDKINTPENPSVDLINRNAKSVDLITQEEYKSLNTTTTTTAADLKIINTEPEAQAALKALITNYQDYISVSFSPAMADEFKEYSLQVKPVWVANAYKATEAANVKNWNYPRAILDSCIRAGRWVDKSERQNGAHKNADNRKSQTNQGKRRTHQIASSFAQTDLAKAGKPD